MRILFVTTHYPWPVDKTGAGQRTRFIADALAKLGHVDVRVTNIPRYFQNLGVDSPQEIPGLSVQEHRVPPSANFAPDRKGFARFVRDGGYDLVVARYLVGATRSGAVFLTSVPVLLDIDDVDWMVIRTRKENAAKHSPLRYWLYTLAERYTERVARRYLRRFAHIWVANQEDEAELRHPHVSTLPNIPVLPNGVAPLPSRADDSKAWLLFVGLLRYAPNSLGLTHFLDHVWGRVLEACPHARLRVVGRLPAGDDPVVQHWRQQPNVDLLGPLEGLDEEYERAACAIAPIYWGGGTKIKVLEALGRGRTCVCAPHALSGIGKHTRHMDSIWHGETDDAFAQGCITLLQDHELRHRMEQRGRALILEHYSPEHFNNVVEEAVTGALTRARQAPERVE